MITRDQLRRTLIATNRESPGNLERVIDAVMEEIQEHALHDHGYSADLIAVIDAAYNALHLETRARAVEILGAAIDADTLRYLNAPDLQVEPFEAQIPALVRELRMNQGDGSDWTEDLFSRSADALELLQRAAVRER